ncbi:hypothetical protein K503DRAFT_293540 [Rhizopogon vinicolor AM-OR11-026]|uniref:C2H2-type domain-containing protein n=1 Tax=Rhizopogon vinicolor AM-OR11-026 TaxID=1314800 RepID=A0A1B7ND26_9AGAM|nr:hypothetical protein K503DRAFT_293540 [Rhizopogon vinicolor AM-OR11-026]
MQTTFSTPPPTTTTTAGRNKQSRDSPSSGIVPETESSQSQPSLPKPMANGKNTDVPLPKPTSRPTSPSEKLRSVPRIAVIRASSSSRSPSHTGHVPSSTEVPVRPRKSATRPIPRISPHTFRKAVEPFTSELDNDPPMSSIESFPSPRKDKGKQPYSAGADELQRSSNEESVSSHTGADLRARGKALYEQELKKKELLRVTGKPPLKKTLDDVARSRVPLVMTVSGKQSTTDTHPLVSNKRDRRGDLAIMQQMEDAYVDLSGGNSTTIDTFTQSGPQDKEAQRVILREEDEESTQDALLGGNPAFPAPNISVAERPQAQPQVLVTDDVVMCDDVQPSPAMPAERSGSNQHSTSIDDLYVASMIVNPSQGQLQERDDGEIIIDLASSPARSPQNNMDATTRRLNHALSALNKKSDEIQALQRELALECEKSSKLDDELKAARQSASSTTQEASTSSADPAGTMQSHPAVSELADVGVKWEQEREVWEAERRKWEEELARLTAERDRLETDAHGIDEVRASWDVDRAAFQLERERWEEERNKLGLQVNDSLSERKTWSEEGTRLTDQITSLTETCGAFEAERAQWEQERNAGIAERAAWASERESWVQQQAVREDSSRDTYREAMELRSAKWEADRVEWASSKEGWEAEREKWSSERATMVKARETLTADVERLNSSLDVMARSKALAEKDRDFFRDQYSQASGFVSITRAENVELEQKAAIAEGQARDGVALIKSMFESQIKTLKEDVDQWRGVAALLQEKDRRTDDLIRRRAAEQPELAERCRQLEDQVDSLVTELELAHQMSSMERNKLPHTFSELQKRQQELRSVKLTYQGVGPGEIIEVTSLRDPDISDWTELEALAADLSVEEQVEDDECDLYPCKWITGAGVIDQCQQAFDCKEDLDRHMHDYHCCHQLEADDSP